MSQKVHSLHQARGDTAMALLPRTVIGRCADWFLLSDAPADRAQRAVSCLVDPEVGDTVLVATDPEGGVCWILAVLTRPAPETGSVVLPGGARLNASQGGVQLEATTVQLCGSQSVQVNTPSLDVSAVSSQVRINDCRGWFDTLESHANRLTVGARTVTSRIGRLFQHCVESLRQVERIDETRAGRIKVTVQGHHQLRAGHISSKAEGFVKIDGQKIDLG